MSMAAARTVTPVPTRRTSAAVIVAVYGRSRLNDSPEHLARAAELAKFADAAVFTGLFYRAEIADYYKANGLPEPYQGTARRKIVPETLKRRTLCYGSSRPAG